MTALPSGVPLQLAPPSSSELVPAEIQPSAEIQSSDSVSSAILHLESMEGARTTTLGFQAIPANTDNSGEATSTKQANTSMAGRIHQNDKDSLQKGNALDCWHQIRGLMAGKRPVVFLDYDGTLSPIVKEPDRAFMKDTMRPVLEKVARLFTTAIVTGRAKEKVYQFVQLDDVYYAGSHGLDISGPLKHPISCKVADGFRPLLQRAIEDLEKCIANAFIQGAEVEDNNFALSVHYRNVNPALVPQVHALVNNYLATQPSLELKHGKMVLEVRPKVSWNKGSAVVWIMKALGLDQRADVFPLYLGDDITDEDAFIALRTMNTKSGDSPGGAMDTTVPSISRGEIGTHESDSHSGVGILVREHGDKERIAQTHADYVLRNPDEVQMFLECLAKHEEDNQQTL